VYEEDGVGKTEEEGEEVIGGNFSIAAVVFDAWWTSAAGSFSFNAGVGVGVRFMLLLWSIE
jgi:hypothetical protein